MMTQNQTARIAGLIYLLLSITGAFSILYIPSRFIDWTDPAGTITQIENARLLFRIGIFSGLMSNLLFLLLPLVLFVLLKEVNKTMSLLMVLFAVVSIPVTLIALGHLHDVLSLLSQDGIVSNTGMLESQIMMSLHSYTNGTFVATLFWGLWLLPFGYLVYNSGFLPKFFGIFLMAGCFGYLIDFTGLSLFPEWYQSSGISGFIHFPSAIGEIGICFWLLIMGIKDR